MVTELDRMPIGQTVDPTKVGGGGTGNDEQNRAQMLLIGHEDLQARYSTYTLAAHGPNMRVYVPGVNDYINGGYSESVDHLQQPDRTVATLTDGIAHSMEFDYQVKEPTIFISGQIFIGYIGASTPTTSTTTIYVEKVNVAGTATEVDTFTFNNDRKLLKSATTYGLDVLLDIPGGRSFFSTDERFRLRVVPDAKTYESSDAAGLRGVSVILWFKGLHL